MRISDWSSDVCSSDLIAAKSFLKKGYSATSIDEIAEAAGTTGPALYRMFDSKQDILDQLCLAGMEMRLSAIQDVVDRHYDDPRDTLRHLVRARIEFAFSAWGSQAPIKIGRAHVCTQVTNAHL